ncbi:CLUMA_CG009809, isoform A [Clunio marinus]|uniref:CLUMA_CG009809, isoform A n=1 Tax=Clunio marinus TaxID=568069 RepID=A0A1J1I800_9DIPT|nr:CLUMA_CG009809, isoform A [Clunio marinus]
MVRKQQDTNNQLVSFRRRRIECNNKQSNVFGKKRNNVKKGRILNMKACEHSAAGKQIQFELFGFDFIHKGKCQWQSMKRKDIFNNVYYADSLKRDIVMNEDWKAAIFSGRQQNETEEKQCKKSRHFTSLLMSSL